MGNWGRIWRENAVSDCSLGVEDALDTDGDEEGEGDLRREEMLREMVVE